MQLNPDWSMIYTLQNAYVVPKVAAFVASTQHGWLVFPVYFFTNNKLQAAGKPIVVFMPALPTNALLCGGNSTSVGPIGAESQVERD